MTRSRLPSLSSALVVSLLATVGCGSDRDRGPVADSGPAADSGPVADSGSGGDSGPGADAGSTDGGGGDASTATDAGSDAGPVVADCDATEVQQPGTTLCWKLCPLEQTLDGSDCTGSVPTETWCDATGIDSGACSPETSGVSSCEAVLGSDYRLPTRNEWRAILDNCSSSATSFGCDSCGDSATCSAMFGTETGTYWASSGSGGNAWVSNLGSGNISLIASTGTYAVRCVRDGG